MFKPAVVLFALSSVLCTLAQVVPPAGPASGELDNRFFYPINNFQPQPTGSPSEAASNLQDNLASQVSLANQPDASPPASLRYGAAWGGFPQGGSGNYVGGNQNSQFGDYDYKPKGPKTYSYGYEINDEIVGSYQQKSEARGGELVVGSYEYDDGYIRRSVWYEADKKGFRIVKEKTGPSKLALEPPTGVAKVTSTFNNDGYHYEVRKADIENYRGSAPVPAL